MAELNWRKIPRHKFFGFLYRSGVSVIELPAVNNQGSFSPRFWLFLHSDKFDDCLTYVTFTEA